jgi:N-acetylglucosamine-6-sulfatase
MPGAEGRNLIPLLRNPSAPWRTDLLIEHWGPPILPTYCMVRSESFAYAQYNTLEEELYDLKADPYEMDNRATDPSYAATVDQMRQRNRALCNPPPPGLGFVK